MSAIANITVFDGAATPVSHTLSAESVTRENGEIVAVWREKLASLPDEAQVCLTARQKTLPGPAKIKQTRITVEVPVMESVSGQNSSGYTAAPKVAYVDKIEVIDYAHPRSTVTSRRLAKQILTNLLGNVSVTTPAISAGVVAEAIDQLLMPT